mmetsp:Transcript_43486/g.116838  ORF Transcript_43486/g.116838 Transcript_43486/m.116838 type:complete len:232 (+) Transcript_43486:207-902(+)
MTCPDLRMTRAAGIGHAVPGWKDACRRAVAHKAERGHRRTLLGACRARLRWVMTAALGSEGYDVPGRLRRLCLGAVLGVRTCPRHVHIGQHSLHRYKVALNPSIHGLYRGEHGLHVEARGGTLQVHAPSNEGVDVDLVLRSFLAQQPDETQDVVRPEAHHVQVRPHPVVVDGAAPLLIGELPVAVHISLGAHHPQVLLDVPLLLGVLVGLLLLLSQQGLHGLVNKYSEDDI